MMNWFIVICIFSVICLLALLDKEKKELIALTQKINAADKEIIKLTQKINAADEFQKQANDKLTDSKYRFNLAKEMELKAESQEMKAIRIKFDAEAKVEDALNQNKVFHEGIEEVVNLWVNDSWKFIADKLTSENHEQQKTRLKKVFDTCRKYGIDFNSEQENVFYISLDTAWKKEIEIQKAKEEQARIREIMKEEQQAERIRVAEIKKIDQERKELEAKQQQQSERIKLLKEMEALKQLTEDQRKELSEALSNNEQLQLEIEESERRKSMAELTKAGHIYVISNVGSFGKDVYKIGMTRRLIPEERVKELSDASVPFPFDIHLMLATENAPELEDKLHEELWNHRINLVNDGKEFFSTDLNTIKTFVDKHGGGIKYEYKEVPEASQWRETQARRKSGATSQHDVLSHQKSYKEVA